MDIDSFGALLISLASLLNLWLLWYQAKKKLPTEVNKQKAEAAESYSEAAESSMNAASISNTLLTQRIAELKKEKRKAFNYIAILTKAMIEAGLPVPDFHLMDTDPNIVIDRDVPWQKKQNIS